MPTTVELSDRAGELHRAMTARAGLTQQSTMTFGLASGLDIGITLLEQSTGCRFDALTPEAALRVIKYFEDEAIRSERVDPQIAIFYRAWAQVLRDAYRPHHAQSHS